MQNRRLRACKMGEAERGLSQCLRPATLRAARRACGYPGRRCVFDIAIVSAPPVVLCWLFLPGREWWLASPEQKRGWIFEGGVGVRRVWTVPPPVALILSGSLAGLPGVRGCNVGR